MLMCWLLGGARGLCCRRDVDCPEFCDWVTWPFKHCLVVFVFYCDFGLLEDCFATIITKLSYGEEIALLQVGENSCFVCIGRDVWDVELCDACGIKVLSIGATDFECWCWLFRKVF